MTKNKRQSSVLETIWVFLVMLLPVILVWQFLLKPDSFPTETTWDYFKLFLLIMITGLGGLGVGFILANKLLAVFDEMDKRK